MEIFHVSASCAFGKEPVLGVIVHWPEALVVQPLGVAPEVGLQAPVTATPFTAVPAESLTVTVTEPVQVVAPVVEPVTRELT